MKMRELQEFKQIYEKNLSKLKKTGKKGVFEGEFLHELAILYIGDDTANV